MKSLHIHDLTVAVIQNKNMPPVDLVLFEESPFRLNPQLVNADITHLAGEKLNQLLKETEKEYQDKDIDCLKFDIHLIQNAPDLQFIPIYMLAWAKCNRCYVSKVTDLY